MMPLEVKKPQAYLFRIALNIAADRREGDAACSPGRRWRSCCRWPTKASDPDAHRRRSRRDPSPAGGALRTAGAASADSHASRLEETPHAEISRRFGISTRTVEKELKAALWFARSAWKEKPSRGSVPGPEKPS